MCLVKTTTVNQCNKRSFSDLSVKEIGSSAAKFTLSKSARDNGPLALLPKHRRCRMGSSRESSFRSIHIPIDLFLYDTSSTCSSTVSLAPSMDFDQTSNFTTPLASRESSSFLTPTAPKAEPEIFHDLQKMPEELMLPFLS